ncbi:MAG: hypothetical protein PHU25_00410 [Deltaproteobacteria bacterium]|nr:hypothetical protein [Deltaproteobacteria bacterium]
MRIIAITVAVIALAAVEARAQDADMDAGVAPEKTDAGPGAGSDAGPVLAPEPTPAVEPKVKDTASNPPPRIPVRELDTRVSGSLRSEMFMSERPQMHDLGGGRYGLRTLDVYPFYETIELRADELGHPGLSVHFQGWAGLDLADVYFDQRVVADPTYLYMQFASSGLDLRLGRQMLFTGATRGLRMDGLDVSYESPVHLGLEAFGGLPVEPDLGPDWYREQPDTSYDDYGAGGSDWEREGQWDYAAGGRVFYRLAGRVSAGVSFLRLMELGEVGRQLVGVDLDVTPIDLFGVSSNVAIDLPSRDVQEANAAVDIFPVDVFHFSVDYRHANPTLLLSHMSIFSVFSNSEYDAVGGVARFLPLAWLTLEAGYHELLYGWKAPAAVGDKNRLDLGYDVVGGARVRYGDKGKGTALVEYRRFAQDVTGMHQLRAGAVVPLFLDPLAASTDLYVDLYDDAYNGQTVGFLGDVGLFYRLEEWEAGGAFTAGVTPYAEHELRGMLRFVYNFDVSFVERRKP